MGVSLRYQDVLKKIGELPYSFPQGAPRLEDFEEQRELIEQQFQETRPIYPKALDLLIDQFLELKCALGSPVEQSLYKDMNREAFLSRLLQKRPLAFLNPTDQFLLKNGQRGFGAFELIGKKYEREPLKLESLLSYDEMAISALIGVSGPTCFINRGHRDNNGQKSLSEDHEKTGFYVALVGARFERPGLMEHSHIVIGPKQNTAENGYGAAEMKSERRALLQLWAEFYKESHLPLYSEIEGQDSRYLKLWDRRFLDKVLYQRRVQLSLSLFFHEANDRGLTAKKPVYAHIVGLGLGLWELDPAQGQLLVDAAGKALQSLQTSCIATVNFSWFGEVTHCLGVPSGQSLDCGKDAVEILFSKRDPAAKLQGKDADSLLVAMYAWDSNAYPGNEFWLGSLTASGDAAAASCSLIAYSQNPDLNERVSGPFAKSYSVQGEWG